jgi:small subunit ribosomal protein S8
MSMTDPIADLLARLRNGAQARKEFVDCPWSVVKERIVHVLAAEGFVKDCTVLEAGPKRDIRVWLRYDSAQRPVITGLRRISKPSRRVYVGSGSMPTVRGGMGISILSTPEGVMVDREATRRKVGGEVICSVW